MREIETQSRSVRTYPRTTPHRARHGGGYIYIYTNMIYIYIYIHCAKRLFRVCCEMGSWFKPICHRDFPTALWGVEDAPE